MPQWEFAAPGGFLGRGPAAAAATARAAGEAEPQPEPAGPAEVPALAAAVLGACEPRCAKPCSRSALGRCRSSGARRTWGARGTPTAAEEWAYRGPQAVIIHKLAHGWQHPDARVLGLGVSYIVRYMGCIEVLRSMRSLDFNTRTQMSREAINRLREAMPGIPGSWKKKAPNKALASILGKSNLGFAGMSISINISVDGLNLSVPSMRQVIASHHMQVISFVSGGDTDMTDYVAYVAKDPINQRGPFADALRLHECSMAAGAAPQSVEDQWPSLPTRQAPIAPTKEQLRQEPWYHVHMSPRVAEKLLQADGDFLVRDSFTNPGQYVLTGMQARQPKHLLLVNPKGVVRMKDMLFESISHLIEYHLKNGQPIMAAESELHLREVVSREP